MDGAECYTQAKGAAVPSARALGTHTLVCMYMLRERSGPS